MSYRSFVTTHSKKQTTAIKKAFTVYCLSAICLSCATLAHAKDYSFSWSANPEPIEGYKLYYKNGGSAVPPFDGTAASEGSSPIILGKTTTFTITGLDENSTYHFTLTAFNSSGESGYANVITVGPDQAAAAPIITNIRIID